MVLFTHMEMTIPFNNILITHKFIFLYNNIGIKLKRAHAKYVNSMDISRPIDPLKDFKEKNLS